jgi:hypothetical protein
LKKLQCSRPENQEAADEACDDEFPSTHSE